MSKLKELIKEMCPNGVIWCSVKDIVEISFWLMPKTPNYTSSGIPYITSKNIKNNKINFNDVKFISKKDYDEISKNRKLESNDLLITMIGTIGETAFIESDIEFYGQNMYVLRFDESKINRKFFNYYFTSPRVINGIISNKNASSQGYIRAGNIEKLKIPVPPLPVQEEIVRILDQFTELTKELTKELLLREKSYTYYSDYIFNQKINKLCNSDVNNMKIEEVVLSISTGLNPRNNFRLNTDDSTFHYITVKEFSSNKLNINEKTDKVNKMALEVINRRAKAEKDDLLLSGIGTIGRCIHIDFDPSKLGFSESCIIIKPNKEIVLPKFLMYILLSKKAQEYFNSNAKGSTLKGIRQSDLKSFKIPVPSLLIQEEIVGILDKFSGVISDKGFNGDLPKELDMRNKQYEYYRDKLLTFKEIQRISLSNNKIKSMGI